VRALVIDDEPLARRRLLALLADEPEIEVVGEASGGTSAVKLIEGERPDLIFLDVQMPGIDGFGVLRRVGPDVLPVVVFVTAYDEHAIRAFDVGAVDYLLKPVVEARLRTAVRRALDRVRNVRPAELSRQMAALLERLTPQVPDRIAIRSDGRVRFVRVSDIDWVSADGDQLVLHVGQERHRLRETMAELEARLPEAAFLRIHRSTIVNVDRVREVQPWFKGDYVLVLRDGTRLMSGRTYRARVQRLLS
jgi:two-component system LytT family response regulator